MPPAQPLANIQHTLTRAVADRLELRFAMLVGPTAEGRPFRDLDVAVLVDRAPWLYLFIAPPLLFPVFARP